MKLTPRETTDMMNTFPNEIHNLLLNALATYGDGTREKRVEIAEFLGSFLTETVQVRAEYFTKIK